MEYIESLLKKIPSLNYNPIFKTFREDITFEFILKLIIIYFFIVWIAIVVWVIKDIWNRTDSILFQIFCILIVLILTPLWIFIYILIRPSKTLFEKYYEEIEENLDILSKIVKWTVSIENKAMICPKCKKWIEDNFTFCPNCKTELKIKCIWCTKEIRIWWKICPFCWKEQEKNESNNKIIETKKNIIDNKKENWLKNEFDCFNDNDLIKEEKESK